MRICCSIPKYEEYKYVIVSNEESRNKVYTGRSFKDSLTVSEWVSCTQSGTNTLSEKYFERQRIKKI